MKKEGKTQKEVKEQERKNKEKIIKEQIRERDRPDPSKPQGR